MVALVFHIYMLNIVCRDHVWSRQIMVIVDKWSFQTSKSNKNLPKWDMRNVVNAHRILLQTGGLCACSTVHIQCVMATPQYPQTNFIQAYMSIQVHINMLKICIQAHSPWQLVSVTIINNIISGSFVSLSVINILDRSCVFTHHRSETNTQLLAI